jgi:hypothetical protein
MIYDEPKIIGYDINVDNRNQLKVFPFVSYCPMITVLYESKHLAKYISAYYTKTVATDDTLSLPLFLFHNGMSHLKMYPLTMHAMCILYYICKHILMLTVIIRVVPAFR